MDFTIEKGQVLPQVERDALLMALKSGHDITITKSKDENFLLIRITLVEVRG